MGVGLVKVVSLLDGWSSDCRRHIRRFAPYIFETVCSLGGGLLVGVSLVEVVSLFDGCGALTAEGTYGASRRNFLNNLLLGWRSSCGC